MIRLLTNADAPLASSYARRYPLETTFFVGNMQTFGLENDNVTLRRGDYYGYFDDGHLAGMLAVYNLGSCIVHFETENAIPFFSEIIDRRRILYFNGIKRLIEPLYRQLKNKVTIEYSESSYFINRSFRPFTLPETEVRLPEAMDASEAIALMSSIYQQCFNTEFTPEEVAKKIAERAPEEELLFLSAGNRIVAQALVQTFTPEVSQIGGVGTFPEYQGKGYAKAVVSELCRRIIARGKTPTLIVKKDNLPAVRAYQSIGFTHYDDYLLIKFTP